MLTKKVNDSLSKHVVTMEALQKEKEGYTDQFQLDFDQLLRIFLEEQEMQKMGGKTFIPDAKPKPKARNIPKEKRDRMNSYGNKVSGVVKNELLINRPNNLKYDPDDTKNKPGTELSTYGRLVAFKQK